MRRGILAGSFMMLLTAASHGISPGEIWPANLNAPTDPAALSQQLGAIESSAAAFPAQLRPAIDFQKVFLQIISSAPEQAWIDSLKRLTALNGTDPVAVTVRDKARIWLARVQARQIDAVLRKYYADNVAFPDSLAVVVKDIPEGIRLDSWGKPWVYKIGKADFSKIKAQRYTLTPADYPQFTPMKDAIGDRNPPPRTWKISTRSLGNSITLIFQPTASGHAAAIMPGGRVDDCTLIFVGPNWALMAGFDQLFLIGF